MKIFFAYPSEPIAIGGTIQNAIRRLRERRRDIDCVPWPEVDIAGRFISTEVMAAIENAEIVLTDITRLNFNVTFELGFAIGCGRRVVLTRNRAIVAEGPDSRVVGIYDTLGFLEYENFGELAEIIEASESNHPLPIPQSQNRKTPVYFLDSKYKTDFSIRLKSRLKKARLFHRSFDPHEQPRLAASLAISEVAQSVGVLLQLVPQYIEDSAIHNLRAAFLAGLAKGLRRELTIVQNGEDPVPIDYRDFALACIHLNQVDEAIHDFAARVTEALQSASEILQLEERTFLAESDLGSSSAENELRDLVQYYVATDQFRRAKRGEARLVVGRKGSGKSALFFRLRDEVRRSRSNVVLDLKPEGYKLLKFKEVMARVLDMGSFEHILVAFWEYVLLLETCRAVLEQDAEGHLRNPDLYGPYRRLAELYGTDVEIPKGDLSERIVALTTRIENDYRARFGDQVGVRLSTPQVTELVYAHDVHNLERSLHEYMHVKNAVWILVDNLDKGWPTHGLQSIDLAMMRALLEATRKIERTMQQLDVEAHAVVFLRTDVFELLIEETPDRGKESKVLVDWVDSDQLRELLRRRLARGGVSSSATFGEVWAKLCVTHVRGEETSQFLIDRCLMRPRYLLDLVNHCKGSAVNLGHTRIEDEDLEKGLKAFSNDVIADIDLEIRDVYPKFENVLYAFIGASSQLSEGEVLTKLAEHGIDGGESEKLIELLLWYGFLGLVQGNDEVQYIHHVNYNMHILRGLRKQLVARSGLYAINPVFSIGLGVQ